MRQAHWWRKCFGGRRCRYSLKLLKPSEKALAISSKISIRMNGFGTLGVQFLVEAADGQATFIEFMLLPLEDHQD